MRVKWFLEEFTAEELSQVIRKPIRQISRGSIELGVDTQGRSIHRQGVEIDFEEEPTEADLKKIDLLLNPRGMRRRPS